MEMNTCRGPGSVLATECLSRFWESSPTELVSVEALESRIRLQSREEGQDGN